MYTMIWELNYVCMSYVICCICYSTGLGAVWKTCNVEEGATVAVFGLGAVGMYGVWCMLYVLIYVTLHYILYITLYTLHYILYI